MILVAAHRRSGTRYTAKFLRKLGFKVGDNRVRADGAVSWVHVGVGQYKDRGVLPNQFDRIFHQLRHPLDVISSAQFITKPTEKFLRENIERELPQLHIGRTDAYPKPSDENTKFQMITWVEWNKKNEALNPEFRFKVEDLERLVPNFVAEKEKHTRKHIYKNRFTWDELRSIHNGLTSEIKDMAHGYGYDV